MTKITQALSMGGKSRPAKKKAKDGTRKKRALRKTQKVSRRINRGK